MSINTPTSLAASGSSTDGTVYTSASVSPAANALLLLFVSNAAAVAGDNVVPTSIGGTLGLSWTQIVTGTNAANNLRGTWYWAKTTGSPPTGTVSMTFSTTQSSCQWHITQITGADLTTPIVQSDLFQTTLTDNPAITLAAIGAGNATLGANMWNTTTALPVGSGYTELSVSPSATGPSIISSVEYLVAGSTTVGWTTTSNVEKCIFAIEVADGITNVAPTANAGADQTNVEPYATVTLDGTASDTDGTIASLIWTQTGGSPTVTLSGGGADPCTFTAPGTVAGTTLTFTLTATDDDGATGTDTMTVQVLPATERACVGGVEVAGRIMSV